MQRNDEASPGGIAPGLIGKILAVSGQGGRRFEDGCSSGMGIFRGAVA